MDAGKTEGTVGPEENEGQHAVRVLMAAYGEDMLAELGKASEELGRKITLIITVSPDEDDADVTLRLHPQL